MKPEITEKYIQKELIRSAALRRIERILKRCCRKLGEPVSEIKFEWVRAGVRRLLIKIELGE